MSACSTILCAVLAYAAAPALEIVKPAISQMDGGSPDPPGFDHVPGEVLYFWCRVGGFAKTDEEKMHLSYSVQAFDSKGVPLDEIYKNEIRAELSSNDKEWMPKIATTVAIPPLAASGDYKVIVKAQDEVGKTSTEAAVTFHVRGHDVAPSETLIIRNFQYYAGEDDVQPMTKAVYHAGDSVWAKFDITGFGYGERNKVDVSYITSVVTAAGKVLWTQPEPAADRSESFYPKRFIPASMSITLQKNFQPGEYAIAVRVEDDNGKQTFNIQYRFLVE